MEALFKQGAQDTALQQLQQADALDGSDLVKEIKMSSGVKFQKYETEYSTPGSEFFTYVLQHTSIGQRNDLDVIFNGTAEARLEWAVTGVGTDEDYIFHVLEKFTDDATKQSLASNTKLLGDLESDLSTRDYNRVKDLLRSSDLSTEQRATTTQERIEAERSWITDLVSNAADALGDENRELLAALDRARADGKIGAEEQAEIARLQSETESSLEVYKTVRNEIEDTAATILSTAAAIVIWGPIGRGTLSRKRCNHRSTTRASCAGERHRQSARNESRKRGSFRCVWRGWRSRLWIGRYRRSTKCGGCRSGQRIGWPGLWCGGQGSGRTSSSRRLQDYRA